jgi:hypothetical protein
MNAQFSATVAMGVVLGAMATGCTVHTYSGAAYPGTTFRSEPTRYEVSYRSSSRHHERDRKQANQPRVRTRENVRHPSTVVIPGKTRERGESVERKPENAEKPEKPATTRRHQRSFQERLAELVDQKNEELARKKKDRAERDARMQRVLGAAADKHD